MFSDLNRPLYEVKAGLFKGLAHPIRIRILEVLAAAPEVTVSELIAETTLEPSHVSQHLAVLRRNRLVEAERRGSLVYYRLAYPQVADLLTGARVKELARAKIVKMGGRKQLRYDVADLVKTFFGKALLAP